MNKISIFFGIAITVLALPIIFRVVKDIEKKKLYENTYAIENVGTGKAIRVHNADISNGATIIGYTKKNWECMTWEIINIEENIYFLKNLYTEKSFQPRDLESQNEILLEQQSIGESQLQHWEIRKLPDDIVEIKMRDRDLYLTLNSSKENSPVTLSEYRDSPEQKWRLSRQNPIL